MKNTINYKMKTINIDINEIINNINNTNLLFDSDFEVKILKNRVNISYDNFLKTYNIIGCQYNRCLKNVCFDMEDYINRGIYTNMVNFINENNLNKKYNYMKKADELILRILNS